MSKPMNNPGLPKWVGRSLRLRRVVADFTLEELGEAIGVGRSTIARWEDETNTPSQPDVAKLARTLGCSRVAFSRDPKVV